MNGDVCADFPLDEILDMHFNNNSHQSQHQQKQPVLITVMATETTRQQSIHYGMLYNILLTGLVSCNPKNIRMDHSRKNVSLSITSL